MTDEWIFEKVGAYWKLPLYKKLWLNFISWFRGAGCFLQCLASYQESIVKNEFTLGAAWSLCQSMQEARIGKTLRMVQSSTSTARNVK